MNYSEYANSAPSVLDITQNEQIMGELVDLVTRAVKGNDAQAKEMLVTLLDKQPQLAEVVESIIGSIQNESEQGTPSMKCGGKALKKARPVKTKKVRKGGCPCLLNKVGGKLVEIDGCTGLPVHRHGDKVKKYEVPADLIVPVGDVGSTPVGDGSGTIVTNTGTNPAASTVSATVSQSGSKTMPQIIEAMLNNQGNTLTQAQQDAYKLFILNQASSLNNGSYTPYAYNNTVYNTLEEANIARNLDLQTALTQSRHYGIPILTLGSKLAFANAVLIMDNQNGVGLSRKAFMEQTKAGYNLEGADPIADAVMTNKDRRKSWRMYKAAQKDYLYNKIPTVSLATNVTTTTPVVGSMTLNTDFSTKTYD